LIPEKHEVEECEWKCNANDECTVYGIDKNNNCAIFSECTAVGILEDIKKNKADDVDNYEYTIHHKPKIEKGTTVYTEEDRKYTEEIHRCSDRTMIRKEDLEENSEEENPEEEKLCVDLDSCKTVCNKLSECHVIAKKEKIDKVGKEETVWYLFKECEETDEEGHTYDEVYDKPIWYCEGLLHTVLQLSRSTQSFSSSGFSSSEFSSRSSFRIIVLSLHRCISSVYFLSSSV
jgi:hypothetical protein